MKPYYAWLLWAPFLGGCFILPSGERSRVTDVSEELKETRIAVPQVPDRHLYGDVTRIEVGQWATYREEARRITIAAVERTPDGLWIEVIEEGDPRQVSARLVGPDGVVKRAFFGEVSPDGRSTAAVPQKLEQWAAPPATSLADEQRRPAADEKVTVEGQTLVAHVMRTRRQTLDGRLLEERTLWHPDVPPVYAWNALGGLVAKETSTTKIELQSFGAGARRLLEVPR